MAQRGSFQHAHFAFPFFSDVACQSHVVHFPISDVVIQTDCCWSSEAELSQEIAEPNENICVFQPQIDVWFREIFRPMEAATFPERFGGRCFPIEKVDRRNQFFATLASRDWW